jgi:hypothetical protein
MIEHYSGLVKGLLIGGEAIESNKEDGEIFLLIILDKVDKISIINRGIIFNYFYNKLKSDYLFREYINKYGFSPKIYPIIISENEIKYHNPFIIYLIKKGKILLDKNMIIRKEQNEFTEVKITNNVIELFEIKKGDVKEI